MTLLRGRAMSNRSSYEPEKHGRPIAVEVRAATPADADAIARVDRSAGVEPTEDLAARIRRALGRIAHGEVRRYSCIALVEGRVVGYGKCAYQEWPETPGSSPVPDGWYLTGVQVLHDHRRRGIGRALTIHRIEWLRERTNTIYYFTGERNAPSMDLHGALGFEIVARGVEIPLSPPFSNDERHVLGRKILV
jgi:GNAT superfamily N-acetyltransferase